MIALLVACPRGPVAQDAGPGDVDAGSAPAEGYCEAIADFFCAFYLRCGRMAVADQAACAPVFLEACNARYEPSWAALEAAGLVALSSEGIEQCRAHLESAPCEQVQLELQGPCAAMWVGSQAAGAPCGIDTEAFTCAPGTTCVLDLSLCGTCTTVLADGETCAGDDVSCGGASHCNDDLVCAPRMRAGERCDVGDRCVLGTTCTDEVCQGPSTTTVGSSCDFSTRCPYASRCIDGSCVATVPLGGTCSPTAPCDSGWCDDDHRCASLVAQGDPCTTDVQCQTGACAGTTCATLPSACIAP
ncbi:MAG: hypothetical protein IT383_07615 [Deltaproteobacteria bacterium]|nr:hypothetical protein [Deltaproteobacteria bacterium]